MAKAAKVKAATKSHVRRGDMVVVTKGKDRGKRGKVKRLVGNGRLEVEKVNIVKRHTKPSQQNQTGGIIDQEGSIAIANVALWCDKCSAPRRSHNQFDSAGNKSRVCVACDGPFSNAGM